MLRFNVTELEYLLHGEVKTIIMITDNLVNEVVTDTGVATHGSQKVWRQYLKFAHFIRQSFPAFS